MVIINRTRDTTLAREARVARTLPQRIKGLLGQRNLRPGGGLILRPCNSVHTFFMRFPIDVLFLDKDNRVVDALDNLAPFRLSPIYFTARLAIELPAGTLQATLTETGDTISIK